MSGKNWLAILLVIALVLGGSAAAFAAKEEAPEKAKKTQKLFSDEDEATWAFQHVARMKAKNVIKGYEDGSFKPNASVSQAEAVVMVIRMKGVEQDAVALAKQPVNFPGAQATWWAAGHINYAAQNNWITADNFKPTSVAKRAWVAQLLVKAMLSDWQAQVQAHANDTLAFKDAAKIDKADVPFIALANLNKWMLGYPEGDFRPEKPVTRAEIAALLDRGEGMVPGNNALDAKGTVTAVDAATRKVTVSQGATTGTQAPATREIVVSADALIFIGNSTQPGTFADIKVGDKVKMVLNTSGVALVVTVEGQRSEVKGTVSAINLTASPRTVSITPEAAPGVTATAVTYNLTADCKLMYQGAEVALTTLSVGDKVEAKMYRNEVNLIKIEQKATTTTNPTTPTTGTEVRGTITAIVTSGTTTSLTVRDANNVEFTYPLAANATLTSSGVAITAAQLQTGLTVTLTVNNSQISALVVGQ